MPVIDDVIALFDIPPEEGKLAMVVNIVIKHVKPHWEFLVYFILYFI